MLPTTPEPVHADPALRLTAILMAVLTFALVLMGSLVVGTEAGDSVPDWPLSYGSLVPADKLTGLVIYEYTHRVIATVLGVCAIVFVIFAFTRTRNPLIRGAALISLGAIVVQGILGGVRVLVVVHDLEHFEGISASIHASLGQLVLGLLVAVAVMSGKGWAMRTSTGDLGEGRSPAAASPSAVSPSVRFFVFATPVVVWLQLVMGAFYRHGIFEFMPHGVGALLAASFVGITATVLITLTKGGDTWLVTPARIAAIAVLGQILVGFVTWVRWNSAIQLFRTREAIEGVEATQVALGVPGLQVFDVAIAASHTILGSTIFSLCVMLLVRWIRLRQSGRIVLVAPKELER